MIFSESIIISSIIYLNDEIMLDTSGRFYCFYREGGGGGL